MRLSQKLCRTGLFDRNNFGNTTVNNRKMNVNIHQRQVALGLQILSVRNNIALM
jgi:hypothetical protein